MTTRPPRLLVLAVVCAACASDPPKRKPNAPLPTPAPDWVREMSQGDGKLCGMGVAGASYFDSSPYPKQMSRERAVKNLAGILGTRVQEAIIDKSNQRGITELQFARALHIDEELIAQVDGLAETEYWGDVDGTGPYAQKGFTYALSCIDSTKAAGALQIDASLLAVEGSTSEADLDEAPAWIGAGGKQRDGRLCAVGFSQPTFHPEKTFERVVEDVRGQLAEVIETLVSSYYEELTNNNAQLVEAMTVASTEALAKGVIVTHFWYDVHGRGPNTKPRSTYGWGCVYPVDVVRSSLAAIEEKVPEEEKDKIAKVRERAEVAFDALDAEIDKREAQ
jgi:hypothetical protein